MGAPSDRQQQLDKYAGLLLIAAATLALLAANGPLASAYHDALHWQVGRSLPRLGQMSLHEWIADGLMAIFFLLVGLEVKREWYDGRLSTPAERSLAGDHRAARTDGVSRSWVHLKNDHCRHSGHVTSTRFAEWRNTLSNMISRSVLIGLGLAMAALPSMSHAAAPVVAVPRLLGAPVEFYLFGLMLVGVAVAHKRALAISLAGLAVILAYEALVSGFPTGFGAAALMRHVEHEWVTLANLLLLLVGFEVLSNQFEQSNIPDHLPNLLPDDWTGGLALLGVVFVMSAFLDNIAAAVLGGVMARHVYKARVSVGFLAAIVASANAGGAGSVIGDTTTTIMWLNGVSPLAVMPAYVAAIPAFAIFAPLGAWSQHRFQAILAKDEPDHPLQWRRIWIVVTILATAVAANILANLLGHGEETAPWLGLALWGAILLTSLAAKPDWSVMRPAAKGAIFLAALVAAASLMPVKGLPDPSWGSAFGLGVLSSVFDNIPLTVLALRQGGYDWALLAYAVGFGGSMVWFGSSAGVALTNLYPEGRSLAEWLKQGWFVPVAYVVGFLVMLLAVGWHPSPL